MVKEILFQVLFQLYTANTVVSNCIPCQQKLQVLFMMKVFVLNWLTVKEYIGLASNAILYMCQIMSVFWGFFFSF